MTDDRERKAAEAKFKKSERATEGAKAMSEYKAEGDAERAKTARLKALREAVSLRSRIAPSLSDHSGPEPYRRASAGLTAPLGLLVGTQARFFAYLPPARRP